MIRPSRGFTLMEMLVVLVITALLMSTLFQSLGIFRRAQARIDVHTLRARQAELAQAWYRNSVEGLFAPDNQAFEGDAERWHGTTLQPLQGTVGAPAPIAWRLQQDARGYRLEYRAGDATALTFPLDVPGQDVHFAYLDESGEAHPEWPPSKGLFPALPAAISIEAGDGASRMVLRYVAVMGPLRPHPVPWEPESDQ